MKIYDLVKKLLTEDPHTRNSDRLLLWKFWEYEGYVDGGAITYASFVNTTAAESITRARREVQEHHPELQASQEVQKARNEKQTKSPLFIFDEVRQVYVKL